MKIEQGYLFLLEIFYLFFLGRDKASFIDKNLMSCLF